MNRRRAETGWWKVAARQISLAATLLPALLMGSAHMRAQKPAGWLDVNVAEYRQHLQDLDALTMGCEAQWAAHASAPQLKQACDAERVGANDRVQLPGGAGSREVRYDWLRAVLGRAAGKETAEQTHVLGAGGGAKGPDIGALLKEAHERLQADAGQAGSPVKTSSGYAGERKALDGILAQKAYRGVTEVSARERFLEWFFQQLDKILAGLERFGAHSPWIVFALRALLLVGICLALIWFFLRIERGSRVHLIPDVEPAPGAPSAREWQLWLKDANAMADDGQWREAIHSVYWAAIARMESRRVWPADRARTPREYLGLVPGTDPRKPALTALTRSFERTWYGGRAAESGDFKTALEQAAQLGAGAE